MISIDTNYILNELSKTGIQISETGLSDYLDEFSVSQRMIPMNEQYILSIMLLDAWSKRPRQGDDENLLILTREYAVNDEIIAVNLGVLAADWPGLADSCIGVIHSKGWNIAYAVGLTVPYKMSNLGVVLLSILPKSAEKIDILREQLPQITAEIKEASVSNPNKEILIREESRKLQLYSHVIAEIKKQYHHENLDKLIGRNGEALKFIVARSRDYLENRHVKDLAELIISNHKLKNQAIKFRHLLQFKIQNFSTRKEGEFTGVNIAGTTRLANLDNLLQMLETICPGFQLKHHKSFTAEDGIVIHRFEIVTQSGAPLGPDQQERITEGIRNFHVSKGRERRDWLESIGGFEHYARVIIPFLAQENKKTGINQVYISVLQSTEKLVDFKILIVVKSTEENVNRLMYQCINRLDGIPGFYISKVKPPSKQMISDVIIMDLKVNLTLNPEIEKVYLQVRQILEESFGKFRDFDAGMRNLDLVNYKALSAKLPKIDTAILREFYYTLEEFYRVTAPIPEIEAQVRLGIDIFEESRNDDKKLFVRGENVEPRGKGKPMATIIAVSLPTGGRSLERVLNVFADYELIMSKLNRRNRDILVCRLSKNRRALADEDFQNVLRQINALN
ncbi:hypothetical protein KAH55_13565 [bacterium]|nr:hypothetical protein [bacterium]